MIDNDELLDVAVTVIIDLANRALLRGDRPMAVIHLDTAREMIAEDPTV